MSQVIKYQNKSIVYTQKGNKQYSTSEVIKAFQNAKKIEDFKDYVENSKERLYASWASVDAPDSDGEHIPIEDIIKDQNILVYKRGGTITDSHTNNHVGKTLAYKVMTHPETGTPGVLHLNKIFDDMLVDDKVWRETQSGERKGSSVGGFSNPQGAEYVEMDGSMVKRLSDFRQFETANVEEPANPFATNVAVSMVAKEKKQMSEKKDIMQEIEQHAKGDEPVTVPQDTTNDVVEDSDAFVTKEEFGNLANSVNEMKDMLSGLTSGGPQAEAEAVEEQAEEEEKEEEVSEEEAEKESVGEGEVEKTMKALKKEIADLKDQIAKSKAAVAQVVKSSEDARVQDETTNARQVSQVKKQKDIMEAALKGQANVDDVLYGDTF